MTAWVIYFIVKNTPFRHSEKKLEGENLVISSALREITYWRHFIGATNFRQYSNIILMGDFLLR